jgi:arylsulfatase
LYRRWQADKLWTLVPAQAIVGQFVQSFRECQPASNIDQGLRVIFAS